MTLLLRIIRPTCPHPPQSYFPYWDAPLPADLPVLNLPQPGELDCLNLSITVPASCCENPGRESPVLVFIHGGAFVGGSHSIQLSGREVFDGTGIVRHSQQLGKDIIVVGINYRVGPLGFLASKELSDYNTKHGEAVGNYGLHDQRRALEWLSLFIAGFGGDPDRITIQGTSAGSASCHYQTFFPNRKFQRAILASGTALGIGALTLERHQERFDEILQILMPGSTPSEGFEKLLSCDTKSLTHNIPWLLCHPLIENSLIHASIKQGITNDETAPDIMVGATAFEDDLADFILRDYKTMQPKSDGEALKQIGVNVSSNWVVRSPETFPYQNLGVLKAYGLEHTVKIPSKDIKAWGHFLGNLIFDVPSLYLALDRQKKGRTGRIWLFRYGMVNTYVGNHSYGKAHHGVNDLFLFNVAPEMIPKADQESWNAGVLQTQRSWIEFVNGEDPWAPVRPESSVAAATELGPIFLFEDHGKSRVCQTLIESVGSELAIQYQSILSASYLV